MQKEKLAALSQTWGVDCIGKEDEVEKPMNRVLNEIKEEAMAKLKACQKKYMLQNVSDAIGLERKEY